MVQAVRRLSASTATTAPVATITASKSHGQSSASGLTGSVWPPIGTSLTLPTAIQSMECSLVTTPVDAANRIGNPIYASQEVGARVSRIGNPTYDSGIGVAAAKMTSRKPSVRMRCRT